MVHIWVCDRNCSVRLVLRVGDVIMDDRFVRVCVGIILLTRILRSGVRGCILRSVVCRSRLVCCCVGYGWNNNWYNSCFYIFLTLNIPWSVSSRSSITYYFCSKVIVLITKANLIVFVIENVLKCAHEGEAED